MTPVALRQALRGRPRLHVMVTDSGLGGLAVAADIAARLQRTPLAPRVRLTYFNAWPEEGRGYNRLENDAERLRVFDRALAAMAGFMPHVLLIACNTLSVLYDRTAFARAAAMPVLDIIDLGVRQTHAALEADPQAAALILGTVTTVNSGMHAARLAALGINPARIVSQPCDQLATHIEHGPDSPGALELIERYATEAANRLRPMPPRLVAALCCTHFGYASAVIQDRLRAHAGVPVEIVNPNEAMAAALFEAQAAGPAARVDMRVLSRIRWDEGRVAAICAAVEPVSPLAAAALRDYTHDPGLF